jgi:nucleotide-binding universal stress UspA family protein
VAGCVIAAIDLGPSTPRVLTHATGMARLLSAPLRILHVTANPQPEDLQRVTDYCAQASPYEINLDDAEIAVRTGVISEAIYREAERGEAQMVVVGARGHGRVARLLLGSTSAAVLHAPPCPVLLVPPINLDIITLSDRVTLNCGTVLAAVDLAESSTRQLKLAGTMAQLARQKLLLLTVPSSKVGDRSATATLRERAHGLQPVRPHALIVRRGRVAEEIGRCAIEEQAGLVVMGVRSPRRGQPGVIASAVLATKRAFVLAVPQSPEKKS